ncbi:response regulator [Azospirillum sp. TSO22-1]|uniref:response regulator n=1 Tax=Azospirillum sp. TSO22-1 TaxID=716789 RepID=UPI0011B5D95C|nr:response regulator [Azospirillum sp. TSO22-1]
MAASMIAGNGDTGALGFGTETRASVLLVDDDPHNLFALEQALSTLDIDAVKAASGEAALRHLLKRDFALILLDVHLPGLNGYEVASMVRQRERNRNVPIIFLSGVDKDDVHFFRGYSAGAVDYVLKPADPVVLRSKVAVFVDLFNKSRELQRQVAIKQKLLDDNIRANAERRMAEEALQRVEERRGAIVRSLPVALYSVDLANTESDGLPGPQFVGDTIQSLSGFPAQAFADAPDLWRSRIHPDDLSRALTEKAAALASGAFTIEYRWKAADGEYRHILDQGVLVRAAGNGATSARELVGTWLDITDRRKAEQQLAQVQKIDALGQLTGGIAHDFNNMLAVIIGNLERVQTQLQTGDAKLAMRVDMAMQGALRCSDLTRQLLAFARRQPLQAAPLDVNGMVRDMMQMFHRTLEDEIAIDTKLAADLGTLVVDRAQVESMLLNLVVNARDAMPDGGTITIGTENLTIGDGDRVFPEAAPGDYIHLAVADTGTGMPPEVRDRAFEPFFTTKELGRGTGLGLSMIYGFVKQSGGAIRIDSEVGRGTSIRILLPRSAGPAPKPVLTLAEEADCPPARAGETVLLVEDDHGVRQMAAEELRDLGYTVVEAPHAAAALERLDEGATPDILFTDIAMPGGMNGFDLAATAVAERPGLRVLYTSAYPEFALARSKQVRIEAPLLQKPYYRHELARALRGQLDQPATREVTAP